MARNQINVIVKSLEGFAARAVKEITLDCVANLVAPASEGGTPIDTGWASSNWIPRIADTFGGTAGSRDSVQRNTQQAGVAQVAATYKLENGFVTITNNVPYITLLNAGHSPQAPAGFVQAAILRAVQGVRL